MKKRITELDLKFSLNARYFLIDLYEVHSEEIVQARDLLNLEDVKKAMRLVFQKDRECCFLTYALVKIILAEILGQAPKNIVFLRNEFGKPYLYEYPLHFNLSHAGNYAFLGLHMTKSVGVDIEKYDDSISLLHGSDIFLFPEEKNWLFNMCRCPQEGAFILWAAKESYLKALGLGFSSKIPTLLPLFVEPSEGLICFNAYLSKKFSYSLVKVYDKVINGYKLSTCII